ncbi:MAG: hypothetical protein FWF33_00525 [Clostridiales bacterium]|nr:hypothetical protein [Clostridiales bacterium]
MSIELLKKIRDGIQQDRIQPHGEYIPIEDGETEEKCGLALVDYICRPTSGFWSASGDNYALGYPFEGDNETSIDQTYAFLYELNSDGTILESDQPVDTMIAVDNWNNRSDIIVM